MRIFLLVALAFVVALAGCLTNSQGSYSPLDGTAGHGVERGDSVRISYILSTPEEQVLDTSYEEVARNWDLRLNKSYGPITVRIGEGRVIQALEDALIGMGEGEQKEFLAGPGEAFGEFNRSLLKVYSRVSRFPRVDVLSTEEFRILFSMDPIVGESYSLNYWNATVTDITQSGVTMVNEAFNRSILTQRGTVHVSVNDSLIEVYLDPSLNSTIMTVDGGGRVINVDENNYTVDLNHPLAGASLLIFLRVEEIRKGGIEYEVIELGGLEFYTSLDRGMEVANETGRPIFLYAHAVWCSWCRKFEADVLSDPVIGKSLEEGFVLVALDVDDDKALTQDLGIRGTPTLIFLDNQGVELKRARGYRSAQDFKDLITAMSS